MRVLGIDPGSRLTGFGLIDIDGGTPAYVASGVIRVPPGALPARLRVIYDGVSELIGEYAPHAVAVERVFVARNPGSALTLGHARGAALCACVAHDLEVGEYTALQIKQAVVGRGHAAKEQVQHMVGALLELSGVPAADAADALACAICHAHTLHARSRGATPRATRRRA